MTKLVINDVDCFIGWHLIEEIVLACYAVPAFMRDTALNSWSWLGHYEAHKSPVHAISLSGWKW